MVWWSSVCRQADDSEQTGDLAHTGGSAEVTVRSALEEYRGVGVPLKLTERGRAGVAAAGTSGRERSGHGQGNANTQRYTETPTETEGRMQERQKHRDQTRFLAEPRQRDEE